MSVFLDQLHYYNEKWSISIAPNLSCAKSRVLVASPTSLFGTTCEACAQYQAFRQAGGDPGPQCYSTVCSLHIPPSQGLVSGVYFLFS